MSASTDKADKEARARLRMCLDKEVTHVRLGDWGRLPRSDVEVTPLGMWGDLHGPSGICTCCPRRSA